MVTITPIRPLTTTTARLINFMGWLGGLTLISLLGMFLLDLFAGATFAAVSLVILTYLLVRKNILDISVDSGSKSLAVRHLPWFRSAKEVTYPIHPLTEVDFVPANNEIPLLGTRWTGRYKLVVKAPMEYTLEFFTSDFSETDLLILQRALAELKEKG